MARGCMALLCAVAAVVAAGWVGIARSDDQGQPTVEALVAEAVERSAELAALQARIRAAEARVGPAGALPDPMASVGLVNIPVGSGVSLDQDPMSGLELMISQEVPEGGKRRLRREVQTREAEMLRARYADKRNEVIREVKQTYLDLQYLDGAREAAEQNKQVAEDLLKSAEAAYASGRGLQQDVFKAQVRLSQMLDMLVMFQQERAEKAARLNRLLYRSGGEAAPRLPALTPTAFSMTREALRARAEANNPKLSEMRARVEQAQGEAELAGREIRPDMTLSFGYMVRQRVEMNPMSGDDMWSARVGFSLPWLYRQERTYQEAAGARAEQAAAEADLTAMRNEVVGMIEELMAQLSRAEQQLSLVETALLPQAEGALASSWKAYGTGQLELMSVLDNQMNLYNLQLQKLDLIAGRERKLAELEYLVGGPLSAAPGGSEVKSGTQ